MAAEEKEMNGDVRFEGLTCSRCHFELDEPFVCQRVECMHILCSVCQSTHDHAEDVVDADNSLDVIRPFIEKYRRSIKECVTKTMSRRAKSEYESMTRLDRSAQVKREITEWCAAMHQIIDEAQKTLLNTIEVMEEDFKRDAAVSLLELKNMERDYKSVNDLKDAYNLKKLSSKEAFKLFALMKKYEETLADPSKTSEKKLWEQTYLSFIPNEDARTQLKSTAYVCGKIKSNIQISIDLPSDKSKSGMTGMTLMGERIAVADKYNHCVKIFSRPLQCGLGGEEVECSHLTSYKLNEETEDAQRFNTIEDIAYDDDNNILIIADEQDNCIIAMSPDSGQLEWKIDMKRPNGVAISKKIIIACSEYEKTLVSFKKSGRKKDSSVLLKDHPISIAANDKGDVAMCTIHGRMSIMNSDLKEQCVLNQEIDGELFRPQRVCSLYNSRFLACDTNRVIEVEPNCVVRRTILVAGRPGTSIPELPNAIACDTQRNIFMGFASYVKVFPVPLEIRPPNDDESEDSSNSLTNSEFVNIEDESSTTSSK